MIQDLSGTWCIKGTDESSLIMDSTVSLMYHDPDRSWITDLIQITPKERTHRVTFVVLDTGDIAHTIVIGFVPVTVRPFRSRTSEQWKFITYVCNLKPK